MPRIFESPYIDRTARKPWITQEMISHLKSSDDVKWNKFMQILKETGNDWHKRRLISKLCMDQCVIVN
jgi:hypothetical protein